jgi:hypothetical protein
MASPFLTSPLDGGGWSTSLPSPFTPGETVHGTQWMGPRFRLGAMEKNKISYSCWESNRDSLILQLEA